MNVRFFGGRKSEYVSIPKHNPIGLYFCADTRELFLGDRLLSDGLRVVQTFTDLPSISEHKAAEGIIYFVAETKNGYVLPRGGSEWVQVIYAPTTGTGGEIDLSSYYTKAEVDEAILKAIANIEIEVDLSDYATKVALAEVEAKIPTVDGLVTKQEFEDAINDIKHPTIDLTGYATVESVEELNNSIDATTAQLGKATYAIDVLQKVASDLSTTTVKHKYEVLPIEGLIVNYTDTEVRVNTQHVDIDNLPAQNAGDGSSSSYYYMTFRAYAPDGATSVIEGQSNKMDTEHSELTADQYGRKYTTIWAAIANKSGNTWAKFGDKSTVDKYLGFYYNFHWYNGDNLIGVDKVRVILTNDACHDDLVPDAVARRIDDKVAIVSTNITNVTEQLTQVTQNIENIENTYVTNETLTQNYITEEQIANTYVTEEHISNTYITVQQAADTYVTTEKVTEVVTNEVNTVVTEQIETKVETVIQEKVDAGEIAVKAESVSYDTW